jgi:hypothetical protein
MEDRQDIKVFMYVSFFKRFINVIIKKIIENHFYLKY